jgi:hypothetical protein
MPVDRIAIAGLGREAQIHNGAVEPSVCGFIEAQAWIRRNALTPSAASKELVAEHAGGKDPALDRPPALNASSVLESDFENAVGPPIDVPLDPDAARSHRRGHHAALRPALEPRDAALLDRQRSRSLRRK